MVQKLNIDGLFPSNWSLQCNNHNQNPGRLFFVCVEMDVLILKFIWKCRRYKIAKTSLKKSNIGRLTLLDFKKYKVSVIITVWYWNEMRKEINKVESPEIDPCIHRQMIFHKGSKTMEWIMDSLFIKWCWNTCISTCKRMNLYPHLTFKN